MKPDIDVRLFNEYFRFVKSRVMSNLISIKSAIRPTKKRKKHDHRQALSKNIILDGYRISTLIGRGSFSLVYGAIELKTGRKVVVKEYFPKHYAKRNKSNRVIPISTKKELVFHEGLKQFFSEARMLKKIQHPNVLSTHSFFKANNSAYLVSLNLEGRDLKWFQNSLDNALTQDAILKVFLPVLSALSFLHRAKMLHLDIKPANILLQPNGQSLLLDFGASQPMDSSKRINKFQTLTHGFAPPEQYIKHRKLGPWTDIYAVAASLFYCISHKLPPKSDKCHQTPAKLDFKQNVTRYHPSFIHAINSSLSFEETERFDTVDSFVAALLIGTKWLTLIEYEKEVLGYDRFEASSKQSVYVLAQYVA